jgi:pectin methylesterase-like acyl-CoA thioesterase
MKRNMLSQHRIIHTWLAGAATLFAWASVSPAAIPTSYPTGAGPSNVSYGADGKLVYVYESNGDRIPDFSNSGYKGGDVAIPNVPVVTTLSPVAGDNRPQIQAAIDNLATEPLNASGFRGAILLQAGVYEFSGTINLNASGIVLRGEGDDPNGTILRRTVAGGDVIEIRNAGGRSEIAGTRHEITNGYVPLGATWFAVDSTAGLAVGDDVVVERKTTSAWCAVINQTNWSASEFTMQWDRTITEIDGNRIRINAPLM